jgi:hypothetical protein
MMLAGHSTMFVPKVVALFGLYIFIALVHLGPINSATATACYHQYYQCYDYSNCVFHNYRYAKYFFI